MKTIQWQKKQGWTKKTDWELQMIGPPGERKSEEQVKRNQTSKVKYQSMN